MVEYKMLEMCPFTMAQIGGGGGIGFDVQSYVWTHNQCIHANCRLWTVKKTKAGEIFEGCAFQFSGFSEEDIRENFKLRSEHTGETFQKVDTQTQTGETFQGIGMVDQLIDLKDNLPDDLKTKVIIENNTLKLSYDTVLITIKDCETPKKCSHLINELPKHMENCKITNMMINGNSYKVISQQNDDISTRLTLTLGRFLIGCSFINNDANSANIILKDFMIFLEIYNGGIG